MKMTIEIDDSLHTEARQTATREGTTLRALVEDGLRQIIQERNQRPRFQLRDASFRGNGMRPAVNQDDWDTIRTLAYEGRGE